MTDPTNHVLDAIDNALRDAGISADAMRWTPDGVAETTPPRAPQRQHPPRFSEPIRWEQHKTTCALAEIEAWLAEDYELARQGPIRAEVDALPPTAIMMHRQHPPCVGCGRPTGTHLGNALTVDGMNQPGMIATFQPCGCQLAVSVPAILEDVPSGTRPERYAGQVITGELFDQGDGDRLVEHAKAQIIQANEECPHVIMVLNDDDPLLERVDSILRPRMMPGDKAVIALWLKAVPGKTEHIVYRAAPDMPASEMPADLEGRWEERASVSNGPLLERRFALLTQDAFSTAAARATGRVEISSEGAVAEVYEVRADHLSPWI